MAKKISGDFFFLSANELKSGAVVFLTKNGWSHDSDKALKIQRDQLEKFEKLSKIDEEKCIIISPQFVELDEFGEIKTLRDKIRKSGITIEIK